MLKIVLRRWAWFWILVSLVACSTGPSIERHAVKENDVENLNHPYVVLISIDGYRTDYTDRYLPPTLKNFREQGASATMLPVYPSKTFTNHYSIATGLYAENHGIVANSFYDSERKESYRLADRAKVADGTWYGGEPLWVTAEKQGMLAANFFWPGSEAAIGGVRPSYFVSYDEKITHLARVNQVLNWLELPPAQRPHFITLYFSDVDTAGHRFGPDSTQVKDAVAAVDQTLGILLGKLSQLPFPINVIIVSDHGMQKVDPKKVEYLDDYTDFTGVRIEGAGPQCLLYAESPEVLKRVYRDLKKHGKHFKVYKRDEMPARYHYAKTPRVGDAIVVVDSPYSVGIHSNLKVEGGNHGFDVDVTPSMRAIFYARGPQILERQKLKEFRNIHVYPFILNLLGLKQTVPIDGDTQVLHSILKSDSTPDPSKDKP